MAAFSSNPFDLAFQAPEVCRSKVPAKDWSISKGYEILNSLYNTDKSVGNTTNVGEIISDHGDIFKQWQLMFINAEQHESNLPSYAVNGLNALAWLSPFSTHNTEDQLRNNYLMAINCVVWALHDIAANNGDPFERGSMKLVDP